MVVISNDFRSKLVGLVIIDPSFSFSTIESFNKNHRDFSEYNVPCLPKGNDNDSYLPSKVFNNC